MKKIFIDGSAGTTGLRIAERLESRKDIEIINLYTPQIVGKEKRKEKPSKEKRGIYKRAYDRQYHGRQDQVGG